MSEDIRENVTEETKDAAEKIENRQGETDYVGL